MNFMSRSNGGWNTEQFHLQVEMQLITRQSQQEWNAGVISSVLTLKSALSNRNLQVL